MLAGEKQTLWIIATSMITGELRSAMIILNSSTTSEIAKETEWSAGFA